MQPDSPATRASIAGESIAQVPVRAIAKGVQEVVATLPGWATEDNGLLHVRGTDDGFLYVIDGVPVYERLDQLNGLRPEPQRPSNRSTSSPATFRRSLATRPAASSTCDRNRSATTGSGTVQVERGTDDDATARFASAVRRSLGDARHDLRPPARKQSDRFLDPVHPDNLHNHGDVGGGTAQLTWAPIGLEHPQRRSSAPADATTTCRTPTNRRPPSQDQRQRVSRSFGNAVVATRVVVVDGLAIGGVRPAIVGVASTAAPPTRRCSPMRDRTLSRAGVMAGLSRRIGVNTLKAGFEIQRLALDESFRFAVTDEDAAEEAGFSDEALEFDVGASVHVRRTSATPMLWSVFLQDDWTAERSPDAQRRRALRRQPAWLLRAGN